MRVGDAVLQWIAADPRRAFRGITHAEMADEIGHPRRSVAAACQRLARAGRIVVTPRFTTLVWEAWDGQFYDTGWGRDGNAYELPA